MEKGGKRVWRWGEEAECIPIAEGMACGGGGKSEIVYLLWREWDVEAGEEGDCIPITMLSPPKWAAIRAILMFHSEGHGHKTVSTNHNFSEEKGEPKCNWTKVPLLTNL